MNIWDYYKLLGLRQGASDDEIKKAYRRKAMEFHPDRNHSEGAHEKFVLITEAYDYLTSHPHGRNITEEEYRKNYQAWVTYRQAEARRNAEKYARSSYSAFKKSELYKSTSVMDGTIVFMGLAFAIAIICFSFYGYFYRLVRAESSIDKPSVPLFVITQIIGFSYLIISLLYFSAWNAQRKRKKKENGKKSQDQKSV